MALAYRPPGVTVDELTTPNVSPLLATPASVGIIGLAQGFIERTDQIKLTGTTPHSLVTEGTLPTDATLLKILSVKDPFDPGNAPNLDGSYRGPAGGTTGTGSDYDLSFANKTITRKPGTIASTGNTTSASMVIANVTGITEWAVGVDISGTGIPVAATVTAVDTTAGTLTISANATATNIGTALTSSTGGGKIPTGRIVVVTYQYVPADYFDAIRLDDLGSVQNRFGPAWVNGAIYSDLTYAAAIAFENGAGFVICQPLFGRATPGNPATAKVAPVVGGGTGRATDPAAFANPATWGDTFYALRDIQDINVFVPVIGQSLDRKVTNAEWVAVIQKAQDHLKFLKDADEYGVVLCAEDGTTASTVSGEFPTKGSIRNDAATLAARYSGDLAEAVVLINTARFTRQRPDSTSGTITVGGQWMAAALAGMLASRKVSSPLTRKQVSGFVAVVDYRSKQDKNDDAAAGLLVVEQKGLAVIVRHAVTIDNTAAQRRELSVVRGKHRMIESLRDTIDRQVIGQIVADANAPVYIKTVVIAVLNGLKQQSDLVDYANVDVRQLTTEPTTIEVRFSYKPAFPINYVNIAFAIDMTTGAVNSNLAGTQ